MKLWANYLLIVNRHCGSRDSSLKDLTYWRDNLFARSIIYLLPLCLIALLPGLYLDFTYRLYVLGLVDILVVTAMAMMAFLPGITLLNRKVIFLFSIYSLGCILLYYLGLDGPGLVFLLASSIFSVLILPTPYKFWLAWLNTFICIVFAIALSAGYTPWNESHDHTVGEWIGVSSNIVFLSFLFSALLPRLFDGIQETIDNENRLKKELSRQQRSLEDALYMLQEKNTELEQFAYVASHDLKEPLRMVTSFMGLVKSKYGSELDEKAIIYIDFAIDGGKRMQLMIDDLLELTRISGRDVVKEPTDLNTILEEVTQNICKLIEETGAEIILREKFPFLDVYRTGFTRLLQNLISNAIKFRKQETNPVIQISTDERNEEWLFRVEDNGIGIENDKFGKIFEIFARLHSQQTYKGTGIGLSVCKKAVEHHGGKIWVESEEGKGSIFFFTIKK